MRSPLSPARSAAFHILERVESTSEHSDDLLHGPALKPLSPLDRNLATALVLGVLRWQIALDAQLRSLLDRPDQPLPAPIQIALRLGAFQLLHMDRIPAHAALSESVELVRSAGHPKAAGLVNAILRKLTQAPPARKSLVETLEGAAIRLGHPAWLVERWAVSYGRVAALAICEYDQHEPPPADLFSVVGGEQESSGGGMDLGAPMDSGSRLVAELAAAMVSDPGRVWDACAAPGGKTSVLARRHPGAELLATDINARRLEAMKRRLDRELGGQPVTAIQADAARLPPEAGSFDLILCDVPCSGTGTFAHNPEIRHRLQASELQRQAERQREILSHALTRLRPGGRLLYSTCSLEPEENERVVRSVLESGAKPTGVNLLPVLEVLQQLHASKILRSDASALGSLTSGEFLRTLPGTNFPGDGFFAAIFAQA
ncbi:MAG TPA: transcription antitermination factor NusB [Acidobacteriaceae bacterium]|nr:transcription antitermination factor NusB [Acidobacteriaceae bacterium]